MVNRQSIDFDGLGEKHKALERISAGQRLVPGIPTIARLDGRAFHTFLKNAEKPFDTIVVESMQETTKGLLDSFDAKVAYVQSDEITLVWGKVEMFDGKYQKLISTIASYASVKFYQELKNKVEVFLGTPGFTTTRYLKLSRMISGTPTFDCRIWQVPNLETAAENILWRELDATKNSVSMLASAHFTEKELDGQGMKDRLNMLEEKGILWGNLPHWLKKGSYYRKVQRLKDLTEEELSNITEKYRPTKPVLRSIVALLDIPPATKIANFTEVLFNGKEVEEYVAI
jgi:tRNA(His) 5'-end guanylyltransferase